MSNSRVESASVGSVTKIKELSSQGTITGVTIFDGADGWMILVEAVGLVGLLVGNDDNTVRVWPDLGVAARHVIEQLGVAYFNVEVSGAQGSTAVGKDELLRRRRMAAGYQGLRMRYRSFPNET